MIWFNLPSYPVIELPTYSALLTPPLVEKVKFFLPRFQKEAEPPLISLNVGFEMEALNEQIRAFQLENSKGE